MEISALYNIAQQNNVEVLHLHLPETESMSIMADSGACYIGMDASILDGGSQERVHMGHELGHCLTGSFYNRYAAVDCRQRHENRADKWAIRQLIPQDDLDVALARGCNTLWELAEWFGVTEDLIRKAVCYYVNGNLAVEAYM